MNKMRRNLIKIRSCAILSWFRFSSYFKVDKRLRFLLVFYWKTIEMWWWRWRRGENNQNEEDEEEEEEGKQK